MNSTFIMINILLKKNLNERCLVNALMSINNERLRYYLRLACIYDGNSNKKKQKMIEMIVYGYMNGKLSKEPLEDISINNALSILKDKTISIKSLPAYGNLRLKKKILLMSMKQKVQLDLVNNLTNYQIRSFFLSKLL